MIRLRTPGPIAAATADAAAGGTPEPIVLPLRDGSRALLRPIRPEDAPRLQAGLALLSPRSRYLRFHAHVDRLSDAQLTAATEVDHVDRVGWVALDADHPDVPGMALAQYARLRGQPEVAEASITVLDHYQGRGLGTIMLGVLVEAALANSIRTFRNYVLADNSTMLELFDQLGAERSLITREVYEVDLALPEELADLPETPAGRALKAFASGAADGWRLDPTCPPVWVRRLRRRRDVPAPAAPAVPEGAERGPLADWVDQALDAADPPR